MSEVACASVYVVTIWFKKEEKFHERVLKIRIVVGMCILYLTSC